MKMILPRLATRRRIQALLERFFEEYQKPDFEEAMSLLASAYEVSVPKVTFYEYLNFGRWGGVTWEDGAIGLQHPENWKKAKSAVNTPRAWVQMVLHEFGHYLFWADAERKADRFANRFLKGLRK